MRMQPFHRLIVWQEADKFVREIYRISAGFPTEEKYGATSQLRRAALSVPLNIVEGQARGSTKDFMRFLMIARGSLSECAYLLEFAYGQDYMHESDFECLDNLCRSVGYLLEKLLTGLRNR